MLLLFRVEWTQGGNGQAGRLPGACTRKHSSPVQLHPWLLARQPPGKSATCQAQRRSGRYDRSEKRRETTTRSTGRCALALMVCHPFLFITCTPSPRRNQSLQWDLSHTGLPRAGPLHVGSSAAPFLGLGPPLSLISPTPTMNPMIPPCMAIVIAQVQHGFNFLH